MIKFFMLATVLVASSFSPFASAQTWETKLRGFTVVPSSQDTLCTEDFRQSMRNLKSIGANIVSIRIAWSMQNATDSIMYPYQRTTSDECLGRGIEFIQSLGMDVGLGMVINGPIWRAKFEPEDRDAWFRQMYDLAIRYSRDFAQPYNARFFSVGTEMHSLVSNEHNFENAYTGDRNRIRWPDIVAGVRANYSGIVTYSAQHSGEHSAVFEDNDLMPELDVLGFSGYWPLAGSNMTGLLNSWGKIYRETILPAHQRYGKDIELAEIGYRPCSFALERPYEAGTECEYDGETQRLAWDALLTFFEDKSIVLGIVGGWVWSNKPYEGGEGDTSFTPWGKEAATTIASYWPVIASADTPQVPFGESQMAGVPYCDQADTNIPDSGWGNLSNYSVNGTPLDSRACIFQGGPADNAFGAIPEGIDDLSPPSDGVGENPPVDDSTDSDNSQSGNSSGSSGSGSTSIWLLIALLSAFARFSGINNIRLKTRAVLNSK